MGSSSRTFAGMTLQRDSRGRVLPILPGADPDAPRAQPKFRVGGDLDQHGTHRHRQTPRTAIDSLWQHSNLRDRTEQRRNIRPLHNIQNRIVLVVSLLSAFPYGKLRKTNQRRDNLRTKIHIDISTIYHLIIDTDGGDAGGNKPEDEPEVKGIGVVEGDTAGDEGSGAKEATVRDNAEEDIKISRGRVAAADEKQVIPPPSRGNNNVDDEDQGITKITTN